MKLRKVGIIGTGHVGSHVAFSLALQGEVDELYLMDIDEKKAQAQAMDINDAVSYIPHQVTATSGPIEECGDCDILVFSAGPLPNLYQDRLESLGETVAVLKDVIPRIKQSSFQGFIISISNPADVVATYLCKHLEWNPKRIISTGTALDSARLQKELAHIFTISNRSITAYCLGEHGGSAMVPWSHHTKVLDDVKIGGYHVLAGKGSTEFGIASATTELIRAVFHDEKKVLPCSCYLNGQYGEEGIFASTPAVIGKDGIEDVFELQLTNEELALFKASCAVIREHVAKAETM
ncbi:MAG: L-lactate dehydrogenase [Veillonella sp.]|nr:L-lactate dehydrogenase [Veillonella sp.]